MHRLAYLLVGCLAVSASAQSLDWTPPSARELLARWQAVRPSLPAEVLRVPLHQQQTDYSCGAASLLSVLRYWRAFEGKERDLYEPLATTPKDGTEPPKMEAFAQSLGLSAELKTRLSLDDLRAALRRGETAILDIQAWRDEGDRKPWDDDWADGHYVVLIGMDADNAYFEDPVLKDAYAYMPLDELLRRWHDNETRHGYEQRYYQAGILVRGKSPAPSALPAKKPVRLD